MHVPDVTTPTRAPPFLLFASTLLVLCAVAGCTAAPAPKDRPVATAMSAAVPTKSYVTGSRLAVPMDPRTGLPEADPSLQVVTQQQIELTGQTNLGAALRQLVPAIQ